ncbi:MAG: phage tail protein [Xanthomonadaceae bacterium]|nr:phage tail protein [Xanthomonadaceae bacterium]
MYALLGTIQFDVLAIIQGMESYSASEYAEHPLIAGKPRLQYVGEGLQEIRWTLAWHTAFCDPAAELRAMQDARLAHQAMALVMGSGEHLGWWVLIGLDVTRTHTADDGTVISAEAQVTLREATVDDAATQRFAPGVRLTLPPPTSVQRVAAAGGSLPGPPDLSATSPAAVRSSLQQATNLAARAQSFLQTASSALQVVQALATNPVAALARAADVAVGLATSSGYLASAGQAFATLGGAAGLVGVGTAMLGAAQHVDSARQQLSGMSVGDVAGRVDSAVSSLFAANAVMATQQVPLASAIARLAVRGVA